MLQRSSLPTTSPAELADSLQRSLDRPFDGRRWQALQDVLPMPATWQQYLLACLALAIVLGGMWLQVLLSVQIARAEFTLRQMRSEYAPRRTPKQRAGLRHFATVVARPNGRAGDAKRLCARHGPHLSCAAASHSVASLAAAAVEAAAHNPVPTIDRLEPTANWLDQTRQWWQNLQQSMSTATGQLWRDVTGRME